MESLPPPPSAERIAAAQRLAKSVAASMPALDRKHQTSRENANFVADFFSASRLHFIGSWKDRYQKLLDSLPQPPPLPSLAPGQERVIAHIDMDCFFASISMRGRLELDGMPVAVSWGSGEHGNGEIASCNYVARAHGIRNGMWMQRAKELCSYLIAMPYEFHEYERAAEEMHRVVFATTPHMMGVSVDECFADLTACADPDQACRELRAAIFAKTGCTASIGLGPNRLLARLATKRAKPDGQFRLSLVEGRAMLRDQPVNELPGVGYSAVQKLESVGVRTCGDVLKAGHGKLEPVLGPRVAANVLALADAIDHRPWEPRPARKSIGAQSSWGVRFHTDAEAAQFARTLSAEVASRLTKQSLRGRQVQLKLWRAMEGAPTTARKGSMGHGMCDHVSRSINLPDPTADEATIAREVVKMLTEVRIPPQELRGMGISVSRLGSQRGGNSGVGSATGGGSKRSLPAQVARAPPSTKYTPDKLPHWWKAAVPASESQETGTKPSCGLVDVEATHDDDRPTSSKQPRLEATLQQAPRSPYASVEFGKRQTPASLDPMVAPAAGTTNMSATCRSPSAFLGSPSSSQAAADELSDALQGMKDTVRLAFAAHALPEQGMPRRPPSTLLAMQAFSLVSVMDRSSNAAKDANEALVSFANELGANALLCTTESLTDANQYNLGIDAGRVLDWLEAVQSARLLSESYSHEL